MNRKLFIPMAIFAALLATAVNFPAHAQSTPDPEIQKAKEETAVVYNLGRFFGYVYGMVTENKELRLSEGQKRELREVMEDIESMGRIEATWADETLQYLELELLTPDQLMEIDQRAIEWQNNSDSGSAAGSGGRAAGGGDGSGSGGGSGPISSYVNGGPFNPLLDESKNIGKGFRDLYECVR
ncbi:MAG: hypothetical protein U5P10_17140 [Spirochaetia bacterium]|nr:hypothetical protein [Spirochaetia bacterium]